MHILAINPFSAVDKYVCIYLYEFCVCTYFKCAHTCYTWHMCNTLCKMHNMLYLLAFWSGKFLCIQILYCAFLTEAFHNSYLIEQFSLIFQIDEFLWWICQFPHQKKKKKNVKKTNQSKTITKETHFIETVIGIALNHSGYFGGSLYLYRLINSILEDNISLHFIKHFCLFLIEI